MSNLPKKTNVQLVKSMMEFSEHGALAQMFIIDAISQKAKAVAECDPVELEKKMGPNSFIPARKWIAVAKEIQAKMDANYNGKL